MAASSSISSSSSVLLNSASLKLGRASGSVQNPPTTAGPAHVSRHRTTLERVPSFLSAASRRCLEIRGHCRWASSPETRRCRARPLQFVNRLQRIFPSDDRTCSIDCENRHAALAADLEQFSRLHFDAFAESITITTASTRREHAIGVLGKIFVAGRI